LTHGTSWLAPAALALSWFSFASFASCTPRPSEFSTAEALPSAPRRADGVALDLASTTPSAQDLVRSSSGLATLRTPLGVDVATEVVSEFFRRVVHADAEGVAALLTSDAVTSTEPTSERTMPLSSWWARRLKQLDYTQAAGVVLYREGDVRVLATDSPSSTVALRVRVTPARAAHVRLFGDELTFWLRRDGTQTHICRIVEEFQLP
jgi:ketosteroid isomerase-like protein